MLLICLTNTNRNIKSENQDAEDDISAVLYNSLFRMVLVISTFGVVKGYHVDNGSISCAFQITLDDEGESSLDGVRTYSDRLSQVVKHATFDKVS